MSDDLISEEALCQKIDKIKVSSAEIVVHGTKEKPYYEIKYFDLSDNETHIGYSSYNLDYVFKWLEECFEIVNGEKRSDRSRNQTVDDLISRKALLKKLEIFNDRDHGNEHFLLGIESAKEIIKNEPRQHLTRKR